MVGKKKVIVFLSLTLLGVALFYLVFFRNRIEITDQIPLVFNGQHFNHRYVAGATFIQGLGEIHTPITNDNDSLYVLNGAGYDFSKFYFDRVNKEIVIRQNIVDIKERKKEYFQVVQVPMDQVNSLVENGKVRVRISYMFLDHQSTLLEYSLDDKKTTLISQNLVGK